MCGDAQDDIDQAAEHQHELEQAQRLENSGAMNPDLFTRPMWPRLSMKQEVDLEIAKLKALNFALDAIFGAK